jgi:predicted hydrocarbon binding protein
MPSLRERLVFDAARGEYRDGNARYMMLRADTLMGLFAELPEATRAEALAAFARAVTHFGGRSARAYRAAGATTPEALFETIAATAPELGWGVWRLWCEGEAIMLSVENSPFAAGAGSGPHAVCAPILGMLHAVGEIVFGGPVAVEETACAATGAACCRFTARRAAPPRAAAAVPSR